MASRPAPVTHRPEPTTVAPAAHRGADYVRLRCAVPMDARFGDLMVQRIRPAQRFVRIQTPNDLAVSVASWDVTRWINPPIVARDARAVWTGHCRYLWVPEPEHQRRLENGGPLRPSPKADPSQAPSGGPRLPKEPSQHDIEGDGLRVEFGEAFGTPAQHKPWWMAMLQDDAHVRGALKALRLWQSPPSLARCSPGQCIAGRPRSTKPRRSTSAISARSGCRSCLDDGARSSGYRWVT